MCVHRAMIYLNSSGFLNATRSMRRSDESRAAILRQPADSFGQSIWRQQSGSKGGFTMNTAFRTDVGRIREINEDRAAVKQEASGVTLALLADGMGGHQAGDVASQ